MLTGNMHDEEKKEKNVPVAQNPFRSREIIQQKRESLLLAPFPTSLRARKKVAKISKDTDERERGHPVVIRVIY